MHCHIFTAHSASINAPASLTAVAFTDEVRQRIPEQAFQFSHSVII